MKILHVANSRVRRPGSRPDLSRIRAALIVAAALLLAGEQRDLVDAFKADLARVDRSLQDNATHTSERALQTCRVQRTDAVRLFNAGFYERAGRRLRVCLKELGIASVVPEVPVEEEEPKPAPPPSIEEIQARAAREVERALTLEPELAKGLEIYRNCAHCHTPEGWGLESGRIPQLAGQHRKVVIKQLADIRAGNRGSLVMAPYATLELIGGAQAVADVAAYIDTLEMSAANGKGPGKDLELGAQLYEDQCARCHGPTGEGNGDAYVPRIQAQHYEYLVLNFEAIRKGTRRNANPEMVTQIQNLNPRQIEAVLDYVSRLEPPEELRAPPGWRNPDFAH